MSRNPVQQLGTLGQSIWLDYIRRDLMASGELRRRIGEDGLRGMTSNPSIFEKAIVDSHDYDEDNRAVAVNGDGVEAIYETSPRDVQSAAGEFGLSTTGLTAKTDTHCRRDYTARVMPQRSGVAVPLEIARIPGPQ